VEPPLPKARPTPAVPPELEVTSEGHGALLAGKATGRARGGRLRSVACEGGDREERAREDLAAEPAGLRAPTRGGLPPAGTLGMRKDAARAKHAERQKAVSRGCALVQFCNNVSTQVRTLLIFVFVVWFVAGQVRGASSSKSK
jgi:hypothetical protein